MGRTSLLSTQLPVGQFQPGMNFLPSGEFHSKKSGHFSLTVSTKSGRKSTSPEENKLSSAHERQCVPGLKIHVLKSNSFFISDLMQREPKIRQNIQQTIFNVLPLSFKAVCDNNQHSLICLIIQLNICVAGNFREHIHIPKI